MTDYQLRGYLVLPSSIDKIRSIAARARNVLSLPNGPINMESFLEQLVKFGITVDVIDDVEVPGFLTHSEACCIPESATIYITAQTYEKACNNDSRTLFTVFHELGHLILMHSRQFHRNQNTKQTKPTPYMDSEWQADQFAAEILMPLDVIRAEKLKSPAQFIKRFGVSEAAALRRYKQLKGRNEI